MTCWLSAPNPFYPSLIFFSITIATITVTMKNIVFQILIFYIWIKGAWRAISSNVNASMLCSIGCPLWTNLTKEEVYFEPIILWQRYTLIKNITKSIFKTFLTVKEYIWPFSELLVLLIVISGAHMMVRNGLWLEMLKEVAPSYFRLRVKPECYPES